MGSSIVYKEGMKSSTPLFSVSDSAAIRIASVIARKKAETLSDQPAPVALRVAVESGGCSGFQYRFTLIPQADITDDDTLFHNHEATVVVDSASLSLLTGAELVFTDKLMGAHFSVCNPNAVSSCGCGISFSVA